MTFQIFQGEELVRTETLSQDIIKVGKLPSSHLRLEDENVSRMHAVIEVITPEEIRITDLGSASGTLVNGKKVNRTQLKSGDSIALGGMRVVVTFGAADDEADDVTKVASKAEAMGAPAAPAPVPAAAAAKPPPPKPPAAKPAAPAAEAAPAPAAANPFAAPAAPANPFAAGPALASPVANPFAAAALANPFAPAPAMPSHGHGGGGHGHGHDDGEEDVDKIRYGIAASGPPVNPQEVETGVTAVEVVLMWGDQSVLHVAHLSPPRTFVIGEATPQMTPDYLIGSDLIGVEKLPIVVASGGNAAIIVPAEAEGEVTVGDGITTWATLRGDGKLQPSTEAPGAMQYVIPPAATAKVKYKGITWTVKSTNAGKPIGVDQRPTVGGVTGAPIFWSELASFAFHASFLLLFYFMPPAGASLSLDHMDQNSRLAQYLVEAQETPPPEEPEPIAENAAAEGSEGQAHRDDSGEMGEENAPRTNNRAGVAGNSETQQLARQQARENAATAGAIGALAQMMGSWQSPTSPYGADVAIGGDPMSAMGALFGEQIGTNSGFGGLGVTGTGRGGGGTGIGTMGLGNLGTRGGAGGSGGGGRYGVSEGNLGDRRTAVPRIRTGDADVRGSLSAEVIRRVIRRHINEVRFCYEQQLHARPDLAGRVTVSFMISATGSVQTAAVSATTLNNSATESCIVQAVRRWVFPAPDGGGIVGVNYPFVLDSSG